MAFKFENLLVWKKAMDFNDEIFQISKGFHSDERFNLTSQIRRAADSVVLNIVEGSTSQSNAEFSKFLGYSIRSVVEVVCALFIARKRNYINEIDFESLDHFSEEIVKMLQGLKGKL